ncbi:ArpU family transcriptional regulator [Enterococcus faecium]|uniref:ArpU family transcriptional regulator n=1 Tax=Enterococcus faecium TaxID=1352 RepID=UPI00192506D7|nr:ArpU family transcriptional regulator [Enterococcus faecium]EME7185805.1 ArpU family transcriptional regulator [Enterococcus faecium]MBL3708249.1 ArpU family transcriptional regulator [Enterococcus faecium]NTS28277.1 ArpU family transcriptional regulator [Enterococcus faecium]
MALFDVKKYQTPKPNEIDMKASKYNFEIFMAAYGSAREKVGKNRMPKMTQSFSPIPSATNKQYSGDAERFLIEREEFMPEYQELHDIFTLGYLSICNPLKQGGTERRRQVFMLRYVYGIGVQDIADRTYLGKTTIVEESQIAFIQFCKATELLIYVNETEPLVKVD